MQIDENLETPKPYLVALPKILVPANRVETKCGPGVGYPGMGKIKRPS